MTNPNAPEYVVSVDQLRVGVFIRIEGFSWFTHPFVFRSFKLKSQEQIQTIKDLGISQVICIPERSDVLPLRPEKQVDKAAEPAKPMPPKQTTAIDRLWQIKRERAARLKQKKERIVKCEQRYTTSLKQVASIMKGIASGSFQEVPQAINFVKELSEFFLADMESTLHLMNLTATEERVYFHSLNVTVLSLMLGREAGLGLEEMNLLGIGSLFHDIGKSKIEKKILLKRTALTKPEMAILFMHPKFGMEILQKQKNVFPKAVSDIVYQHHELCNGKGYPEKLTAERISRLTKIVSIVNTYDNHCNKLEAQESLTPYQALSFMFTQQKQWFDLNLLTVFIRCLGVYPPGSIVALNNGAIGLVISVNAVDPLYPSVLIYDPDIPKEEAIIVDLKEETDLKVEKSVRPAKLPEQIYNYLSPRQRITYYVDPTEQTKRKP
ncbi:MAG: DUF3391 domain-containing protein [Deltaproteobacteria bacterium]|nr:DUF3391 domain-containing protein [Deltaproteobacteria bacterium]